MEPKNSTFDLSDIIKKEQICTFFQPIVNLKTGTIFAYEALVRGLGNDPGKLITPCELFDQADRETCSLEFDRLCRKKALETFQKHQLPSNAMMFMNINTSVISNEEEKPHLNSITQQMGFAPARIGLELIESPANSAQELIDFVSHYRNAGFLIIIDDFGCKQSNLDRLIQIHPDVIKIDRSIISCIENDPYRQSILKSIKSLAEMTGALCLAEGVETLPEILTCHLLGVDLFQGFAIAFPSPDIEKLEKITMLQIKGLQKELQKGSVEHIRKKRRLTGDINMLADWLIRQIEPKHFDSMHMLFQEFIAINNEIECVYLLDSDGYQISETISSPFVAMQSCPSIFAPAPNGTNHSLKPFFTCFEALGINRYLTDVYLSLASGNLCRTFSVKLPPAENCEEERTFILCIDFLEEAIRTPTAIKPS